MTKEERNARLAAVAVVATGTALSGWYVVGMTTTVLAKTALPGAITTSTTTINGAPAVYSLVKASMLSKCMVFGLSIGLTLIVARAVYKAINKDNSIVQDEDATVE